MRFFFVWIAGFVAITFSGCEKQPLNAVISGGSMFPSLLGEHFEVICDDCKYQFVIDANVVPKSGSAICPNCGFTKNGFETLPVFPATEVQVSELKSTVKRWDLIAFRGLASAGEPEAGKLLIKRVIGLSGEKIRILDGNIFVDGALVSKPARIAQQLQLGVFDSKYLPPDSEVRRFTGTGDDSNWSCSRNGVYVFVPSSGTDQVDWLNYRHIRGYRHSRKRNERVPVEDSYAYNQNVSRQLNLITETRVDVALEYSGDARLHLRLVNKKQDVHITFEFSARRVSIRNGIEQDQIVLPLTTENKIDSVAISNFDSQLLVECNAVEVFRQAILDTGAVDAAEGCGLQIGGQNDSIRLSRIRINRDVYYLNSASNRDRLEPVWQLSIGEYFVLGDNAPVSIDSRQYGPVNHDRIIGIVRYAGDD